MKSSNHQFKFLKTALIWTLIVGAIFASCSKKSSGPSPVPVDKTTLQASVTVAQGLNDNTVEGTKPGQYVVGTKEALTAA